MKTKHKNILSAAFFSAALLGAMSITMTLPFAGVAYAKGGNDGGNGGGDGGNGGGNGGNSGGNGGGSAHSDRGNSGGSKKSTGAGKAGVSESGVTAAGKHATAKPKKSKTKADLPGASASDLGALNAAHASPQALANASPNSRVGRIAAYRDAVLGRADLLSDYDLARAALDAATPPSRDSATIGGDIAQLDTDIGVKAAELSGLQAELAAAPADADTTALAGEIAAVEGEIDALSAERATVQAELDAAKAYDTLTLREAELRQAIADQPATELGLLEAAANKPVTDAVVAAVNNLLGLDPAALIIPDAPQPPATGDAPVQ